MSRTGFIVSFNGPGIFDGRIDVRDLAPALISLGRLIDSANLIINGERYPIKVEVKATSVGSFEVTLDVVLSSWDFVKNLLDSPDARAAETLLKWIGLLGGPTLIGTLFALYRFLKGKEPEKIVKRSDHHFLIELEGRQLIVPYEVMRLYQETSVNKAVNDLLFVLEKETIDRIDFRPEGTGSDEVSQTLTREDRASFAIAAPQPQTVLDETRKLALSIRSLAFQEGNKWRLYDGQNTITATIEDKDFIYKVDQNLIRFAKGDILICEVRTVQSQGQDGLRTEHYVVRVAEHRQPPLQIILPFSADDM